MITKEDLEKYRNELVIVGIPYISDDSRLFFHHGNLKEVDDDSITLVTKDRIEIIALSNIKHFRVSGKRDES